MAKTEDNKENNKEKELLARAVIVAQYILKERNILVAEREMVEHQFKNCEKLSLLAMVLSIIAMCINLYSFFN